MSRWYHQTVQSSLCIQMLKVVVVVCQGSLLVPSIRGEVTCFRVRPGPWICDFCLAHLHCLPRAVLKLQQPKFFGTVLLLQVLYCYRLLS